MSYQISIDGDAITMKIPFEEVSVVSSGKVLELLKLPMTLPFSCKARSLTDMDGGTSSSVYVFKRVDMDPMGYDSFARNFLRDAEWLCGQSVSIPFDHSRACIMLVCPSKPILFIDTQGFRYARYVARLG